MVLAAACGGNAGNEVPRAGGDHRHEAGGAACRPSGRRLSIAADNIKFDKQCLAAPADEAFSIEFNNKEQVPHNISIAPEHDSSSRLFTGETFSGPAVRTYDISALQPGTYHFHCDVHPEMQGDFVVG